MDPSAMVLIEWYEGERKVDDIKIWYLRHGWPTEPKTG